MRGKFELDLEAQERIGALLDVVAESKRPCLLCQRTIWLVRKETRLTAYTDDGVDHAKDCRSPEAAALRGDA